MEVPQKIKIELLYDPAIPLLGMHLKEMETPCLRDICISMFLAALFTIAKRYKQTKYPSIDDG